MSEENYQTETEVDEELLERFLKANLSESQDEMEDISPEEIEKIRKIMLRMKAKRIRRQKEGVKFKLLSSILQGSALAAAIGSSTGLALSTATGSLLLPGIGTIAGALVGGGLGAIFGRDVNEESSDVEDNSGRSENPT